MKLTRNQLKKIILETLLLNEGDTTGPLVAKIEQLIDETYLTPTEKDSLKVSVNMIEASTGPDLIQLANSGPGIKFLNAVGFGVTGGVLATVFSTLMYVGGLFQIAPGMIKATIDNLNTVPGKIRNLHKFYDKGPLDIDDIGNISNQDFADLTTRFGVKSFTRDDMVDMLAIGIDSTEESGSSGTNPLMSLFSDEIISENFFMHVMNRYYQIRKERTPEAVKEEILKQVAKFLKDSPASRELSLLASIKLVTSVI